MFYKAVFAFSGQLNELISLIVTGAAKVIYIPNEWVEAPPFFAERGYGICVFDSPETAVWFVESVTWKEQIQIWECDVVEEFKLPVMCNPLWIKYHDMRKTPETWPEGTRMFKRIRLTKRVR